MVCNVGTGGGDGCHGGVSTPAAVSVLTWPRLGHGYNTAARRDRRYHSRGNTRARADAADSGDTQWSVENVGQLLG